MVINRGDIYWVQLQSAEGEEPRIPHPHVVIHENAPNPGDLNQVVVCALTSNLKRVSMPGAVLLDAGEANLPRPSVVEVSKISTVEKSSLGEYIGTLSEKRVQQILAGMRFLQASFFEG